MQNGGAAGPPGRAMAAGYRNANGYFKRVNPGVRLALAAAGGSRFAALGGLADEWQQAVEQGLGEQDLTAVTRALAEQGGTP